MNHWNVFFGFTICQLRLKHLDYARDQLQDGGVLPWRKIKKNVTYPACSSIAKLLPVCSILDRN